MDQSASSLSILESATALFAQLGYDGTDLDLLAAAAGVDKGILVELFGTRRELYLKVMERAYELEMESLQPLFDAFVPTPEGAVRLVDGYLDFCLSRPTLPSLWMHRWLADAADIDHLEDAYLRPVHSCLGRMLRGVLSPDVDIEFAVWTITWSVHGFISALQAGHSPGEDFSRVSDFRRHLHGLVHRFIAPESLPEKTPAHDGPAP
jgi:AcrR family transcriptional regulator